MKNFKKIIFVFILISLLAGGFCLAQGKGRELEIEYPGLGVPGVETPTITESSALGNYLKYIFTLAVIIGGLIVFGALIYGGILYLTSAGDPTKMKGGRDQIMAGFFGLIILLSSYLILNTINPQLVVPETPSAETLEKGIYLCVNPNCVDNPEDFFDTPVPITQGGKYFDLKNILPKREDGSPQTLQSIKFRAKPEDLTVKVYSDSSCSELTYSGNEGTGEIKDISGNSIELVYHWPGVYLYAGKNCDETSEYKIYQISSSTLPDFNNKAQSIKFVYGFSDIGAIQVLKEEGPTEAAAKNIAQARCQERGGDEAEYVTETEYEFQYRCKAEDKKYAAILHKEENSMGEAALFDQEQNTCFNLSDAEGIASNRWDNPGKYYGTNPIGISSCEAATCADTDEGQVWDTYGECAEDGTVECKDLCFDGDTLWECYCDISQCRLVSYDCPEGEYCRDGACHTGPPPADCDDTDGGKDYDTLGSCYEINGSQVWIGTDECKYGSNTILIEYYCDPATKRCKTEEHNCSPNGCSAGICTAVPPTCGEDDGGINYNQQGTCSDSEGSHTDYCEDSTFLLEYFCKGGYCSGFTQKCSPGNCQDGKCSQIPNCMRPACELEEKGSCMCGTTEIQNQYCCAALSNGYNEKDDCLADCGGGGGEGGGYGVDLSGNVSSITIYLKPLEETPPGGVTFFGDENYTANKDPYILGPYKNTQEPNLEEVNNKITSMKMEGHYVALLFDGVNYTGECEVFMSSVNNLRNHRLGQCGWWGRNDCLESFIIRARK